MYPDAEGTLVDHRFGGGVLSASKYSLLKESKGLNIIEWDSIQKI